MLLLLLSLSLLSNRFIATFSLDMDLSQTKLTKAEWQSIEVPVAESESAILSLIMAGYDNPAICVNTTTSLLSYMKIDANRELEFYLYKEYFAKPIQDISVSSTLLTAWVNAVRVLKTKQPNKADMIRITNVRNSATSPEHRKNIFEFVLIDFCAGVMGLQTQRSREFYLYSLVQFRKSSIQRINPHVAEFVDCVVSTANIESPEMIRKVFAHSADVIEKNPYLIQYEDRRLYSHQERLFTIFHGEKRVPKLVLYMAPTGTGKTMSPLGLSQKYRIIFVCVARHVGVALARSAISMGKKVAFAFGCSTASDIRLHYFAAKDYKINKRSGGIGKVDNSVGDKVEIMICDVASYLTAMYYMLAFNDESDLITYWDEPTITMDQESNPLHETIHKNWCDNTISKMVLSCATLPSQSEIQATLMDFQLRFTRYDEDLEREVEPEIHSINSYDCKKTITLLNKEGRCVLPHLMFPQYRHIVRSVEHCEQNKTLMRYFNMEEVVRFILYAESRGCLATLPEAQFKSISDINMNTLKLYYLSVLKSLPADRWPEIYSGLTSTLAPYFHTPSVKKIQSVDSARRFGSSSTHSLAATGAGAGAAPLSRTMSMSSPPSTSAPITSSSDGILLTTRDAHTLTDGPTIFIAEDVDKIGKFYIQQSKIPENVYASIMEKIEKNNQIQRQVDILEKELADKMGEKGQTADKMGEKDRSKKADREPMDKETQRLLERIAGVREQIQMVAMNSLYIPNTKQHQDAWLPAGQPHKRNAFVPNLDEEDVREIMGLDVDTQKKLMLIMGIGVFSRDTNQQYAETMKRLAYEQRLFLIIASSDYIYGTNYQFCHGFVGKDLVNMTQQKTIQAIGRIGRNNIQQEYTVRFRDDAILEQLFRPVEVNLEAVVMSRLFVSEA